MNLWVPSGPPLLSGRPPPRLGPLLPGFQLSQGQVAIWLRRGQKKVDLRGKKVPQRARVCHLHRGFNTEASFISD